MTENHGAASGVRPKEEVLKPVFRFEDPVPNCGFETICTHFAENPAAQRGAVAPPIYQNSTFVYPDAAALEKRRTRLSPQYDYTRAGNPTNEILEAKLARLEKAEWAECFGSGMAAIAAAINACIGSGAHVVTVSQCYGATRGYLEHLGRFGVETTYVDGVAPEHFIAAIRPNTRLIHLESPTSGRFEMPEIEPIARAARERGVRTVFDNSWATPYFQNPLELGVDLVVHSASKYLNGHADVVAGVVAGRDEQLRTRIWNEIDFSGGILDPHAAWLMLRGLRTLALRMERHQENALAAARMLESHPRVACVMHPGLESHPQHAIALRQLRGCSGLFSFALKEQTRQATNRLLDRLRLFGKGVSWGGYDSLALGGTLFSRDFGRPEWVVRLSVGLETKEDLLADLRQALED